MRTGPRAIDGEWITSPRIYKTKKLSNARKQEKRIKREHDKMLRMQQRMRNDDDDESGASKLHTDAPDVTAEVDHFNERPLPYCIGSPQFLESPSVIPGLSDGEGDDDIDDDLIDSDINALKSPQSRRYKKLENSEGSNDENS